MSDQTWVPVATNGEDKSVAEKVQKQGSTPSEVAHVPEESSESKSSTGSADPSSKKSEEEKVQVEELAISSSDQHAAADLPVKQVRFHIFRPQLRVPFLI